MSNVAMVAYTHYRSDPRVRREAEALVTAGYSVTIFCLADESGHQTSIDGVEVVGIFPARYRGANPLAYVVDYARFTLAAARALGDYHRRRSFALVQAHTMPDFVVFCARALKRAGVPVLLDIHDLMPELFASKFGVSDRHPIVRIVRWQERRAARFADRCLAVHHRHGRLLAARTGAGDAIDVIHNLPDPRWFSVSTPVEAASEEIRVVYHGTVAHRHGVEVAVKAMEQVHGQFPSARFEVFGDGDAAASVVRLVDELNAAAYVRFRPRMMPLEQLVPAIRGAGVGLIPLLGDPFTHYMLPTKLLEYVAMGVPVICSDLRTIRDYFSERQVRYVRPGRVDDLATALRELLSDPDLRRRLATEAGSFYARYNWSSERVRYLSIVEGMMDGQVAGRDRSRDRSVA